MTLKEQIDVLRCAAGRLLDTLPLEDMSGFTPEQRRAVDRLEEAFDCTGKRTTKPRPEWFVVPEEKP